MALSVIGYQHYYKNLRMQGASLRKATNQMGDLKQDMSKLRKNYDSVLGVDTGGLGAGGKKSGGVGAGISGGMRANANKRMKELQKRRKSLQR